MLSAIKSSSCSRAALSRVLKSPLPSLNLTAITPSRQLSRPIALRAFATSPYRRNDAQSSSVKPIHPLNIPSHASTSSTPAPVDGDPVPQEQPKMAIAFTCTVTKCGHRQAHVFSKRSYEKGIVIITCSGCKNRHLIADHLGWFDNLTGDGANVTIEKLAKAHGVPVARGVIGEGGLFEYDGEQPPSSSDDTPKAV